MGLCAVPREGEATQFTLRGCERGRPRGEVALKLAIVFPMASRSGVPRPIFTAPILAVCLSAAHLQSFSRTTSFEGVFSVADSAIMGVVVNDAASARFPSIRQTESATIFLATAASM